MTGTTNTQLTDVLLPAVLTDHDRRILEGLPLHHTDEDELLWPELLERCRPDEALIHRREAQLPSRNEQRFPVETNRVSRRCLYP